MKNTDSFRDYAIGELLSWSSGAKISSDDVQFFTNVSDMLEEDRDKIRGLEAENKRLREVLRDLVEIDRRDSTCDPDLIATDRHREEAWSRAKAALAQTGKKS